MDESGCLVLMIIGFVAFMVLAVFSHTNLYNKVNQARTVEELRVACSGVSIQYAPVRCLELGK